MLEIVIATSNRHKVRELRALLPVPGIRWRSLAEFPSVPVVRETGRTFEANAMLKAQTVARATGRIALADDSGLEVDALHGAPGVRSARFAGRHGADRANNDLLLRRLRGLPPGRRRVRYRCALALAIPAGVVTVTHGAWGGRIADRARGRGGFGYDPIFFIPRFGKTVGQLPMSTKRRLSHRAQAARKMRPILQQLTRVRPSVTSPVSSIGDVVRLECPGDVTE